MNAQFPTPHDLQAVAVGLAARFGVRWEAGPYTVIEAPPEGPVVRHMLVRDGAGLVTAILSETLNGGETDILGDAVALPQAIRSRLAAFEGQIPLPPTAWKGIVPPTGDNRTLAWLADPTAPKPLWLALAASAELFSVWRGDRLQLVVDRAGLPYEVAMDRLMAFETPPWRQVRHGEFEDLPIDTYRFNPVEDSGTWKTITPRPWDETTPLSPRTKARHAALLDRIAPVLAGRRCPATELAAQRDMAAIEKAYAERQSRQAVTQRQVDFMAVISERLGVEIPRAAYADRHAAGQFIGTHADRLRSVRKTPAPVAGRDAGRIDFPYPPGKYDGLQAVMDDFLALPETAEWEHGYPSKDGRGLEPYASVVRNARHALAGKSLRGLDLRIDLERFMLPGTLGVIRRPEIVMVADMVDHRNLFLSWTSSAENYGQVWDANAYAYGRTALLVFDSLSELASYPGLEPGSWVSRTGNPELDAWCLEIVYWTLVETTRKLRADFGVHAMPGFAVHYRKPDGHGAAVPYNWSCSPDRFVQHARDASAVDGAVTRSRGMSLVPVMAEINRHRRNRKEIGAADWPTTQRAAWKLLRRWMRDVRLQADPDPQALIEDDEEDMAAKRAKAAASARQRKLLAKVAETIKSTALAKGMDGVALLEAIAPFEKEPSGTLLEKLLSITGPTEGLDTQTDLDGLLDILFHRQGKRKRRH